jgi:exonuclease III
MALKITTLNVHGISTCYKRAQVFDFLKTQNFDIIFLQETFIHNTVQENAIRKEWSGPSYWSLGKPHSCGVAILFKSTISIEILRVSKDNDGRLLSLTCRMGGENEVKLTNIYCPNKLTDRNEFIDSLTPHVVGNRDVVLAGDFNFVENPTLDKRGGQGGGGDTLYLSSSSITHFKDIKIVGKLIDSYRALHPTTAMFTHSSAAGKTSVRLDRIYVSSHLKPKLIESCCTFCPYTDHGAMTTSLQGLTPTKGKGYWKCNSKILNNVNFKDDLEALWQHMLNANDCDLTTSWWDQAKGKIKTLIVEHSCRLANNKRVKLKKLNDDINRYQALKANDESIDVMALIQTAKAEITAIHDEQLEGTKLRAKINFLNLSEKHNEYFLKTEKRKAIKKEILSLNINGTPSTDQEAIADHARGFYNTLLTDEGVDSQTWPLLVKGLPTLSPNESHLCEGDITYNECWKAIKAMQPNKSPGSDGLPAEFHKTFFYLIGPALVTIINNERRLSKTQSLSLITLLCKDSARADDLDAWRPISLLNCDYKIISKVLHNRLKLVANRLIGVNQTCGMSGRSIQDNLHFLRNVFDYCRERGIPCIALCFDQAKAFDRVNHSFLFYLIEYLGFGKGFLHWIKALYSDIESCVIVNGHISSPFKVTRSMRQGCGLSPLLYGLSIETLAHRIRSLILFKGIPTPKVNGAEDRLALHADDTTVLAQDTSSVNLAIQCFDLYSKATGAKLNNNKSMACIISGKPNLDNWPLWLKTVHTIKVCGIFFGDNAQQQNESIVLTKLVNSCEAHQNRYLTMMGRAVIINTLFLTKLWYVVTCVDTSQQFIARAMSIIHKFMWKNTEWIARATIIRPLSLGGLGLQDIRSKIATMRIKYIFNLISKPDLTYVPYALYWSAIGVRKYKPSLYSNFTPKTEQPNNFHKLAIKEFRDYFEGRTIVENKKFSSKKCYDDLIIQKSKPPTVLQRQDNTGPLNLWKILPHIKISTTARNLFIQISHHILPVADRMFKLGIARNSKCSLCTNKTETMNHIFMECSMGTVVRQFMISLLLSNIVTSGDGFIYLLNILQDKSNLNYHAIIISEAFEVMWFVREKIRCNQQTFTPITLKYMYINRLKGRIKADHSRLDIYAFKSQWCHKPLPVTLCDTELHLGF